MAKRIQLLLLVFGVFCSGAWAQSGPSGGSAPEYRVDPFWPKALPNNWILGQVAGVATDLTDGMARAEEAATSGAANDVLERFIEMTGRLAPAG